MRADGAAAGAPRGETWLITWAAEGHRDYARLLGAAAEVLGDAKRLCVAALEQHSPWWEPALTALPRENIFAQPFDRGTGAGVLLALLAIQRRDPDARLVVLPAASALTRPWALERLVRLAGAFEPGEGAMYLREPGDERARLDHASAGGALMTPALTLLGLFACTQAEALAALSDGPANERGVEAWDRVYPFLPMIDLGRHVLAPCAGQIRAVLPREAGGGAAEARAALLRSDRFATPPA